MYSMTQRKIAFKFNGMLRRVEDHSFMKNIYD